MNQIENENIDLEVKSKAIYFPCAKLFDHNQTNEVFGIEYDSTNVLDVHSSCFKETASPYSTPRLYQRTLKILSSSSSP